LQARRLVTWLVVAALSALSAIVALGTPAAAAEGYVGPNYTGTSAPTAEKPQSKLWYNDGYWWGSLFDRVSTDYTIHRLNPATQTWVNTGVLIDERYQSHMDVLWDGTHLYVASAGPSATSSSQSARLYRFSYNAANDTYTLDPGYPVTPVTGGMEAIVMDQDSLGRIWITYTRNNSVWVVHTVAGTGSWVAPYVIPTPGANNLTADDISAVVTFGANIGVIWGNQNEDSYYFAVHPDNADDTQWTRETAYTRSEGADDHINVKSIQSDPQGRVFAIIKTSVDLPNDPLNVVLVRKTDGTWDGDNVFGRKQDNETRAILVLDAENQQVHAFASAPCCSGGTVYRKTVTMSSLLTGNPFGTGLGTPFIQSGTHTALNNPTSTKQSVSGVTDLVVLAGDDNTRTYMHNRLDIASSDTTPPETTITSGPTGNVTSIDATFTFTSDEAGSTFQCSLDSSAFTPCSSPQSYSGLQSGSHDFSVRATDPAGNTDPTPASRQWTVQAPLDTTIVSAPPATTNSSTAQFEFTANTAGATFACSLDGATPSGCSSPVQYTGISVGQHTFAVAASVGSETDPTPATHTWTVDYDLPTVVPADGDATVAQATPTANFGSATMMESDTSPLKHAFARYTVSGVAGSVTGATLRYYITNSTNNGPKVYRADPNWSDATVTWDTRPALTSGVLDDKAAVAANAYVSYDVTSQVTGNGTYAFGLIPDSSDGLFAATRESTTPPELVLQLGPPDTAPPNTTLTSSPGATSGPAVEFAFTSSENGSTFECSLDSSPMAPCTSPKSYTGLTDGSHTFAVRAIDPAGNVDPTPATHTWTVDSSGPVVQTFTPFADARVEQATATVNYGIANALIADTSPAAESYLAFDASSISGTVSSAVLRVFVTNASVNAPAVRDITSPWSEGGVTWNTRPTVAAANVADLGAASAGVWIEYNVTPAVSGPGTIDLALIPQSSDGITMNSREATTNAPQLVITTI
jgi:hypothetical protein